MTIDENFALWMRNVQDKYKGMSSEDIKLDLQKKSFPASVMMSQIEGDFNFGSVIRSANNFNFRNVFYYGKKRYDKRSACGTYNYTDVSYLVDIDSIKKLKSQYHFVALENNLDKPLFDIKDYKWKPNSLIIIGEENKGISPEVLELCDEYVTIPSLGSVRSLNAAVAASISFYDYVSKF